MLDVEKLQEMERRFEELENRLCNPEVLADPKAYQAVSKERKAIEEVAGRARELRRVTAELQANRAALSGESDPEMKALYEADIAGLASTKADLEDQLTRLLLPQDPYAGKDIIMEIRPAAGGDEATLFASELLRMYLRYAEGRGWKSEILSRQDTEVGGLKEVSVSILGDQVYRHLKFESGVHRVQRVPATEASGRIHTSTVTVAVLPEADDVDEIPIRPEELRIDTYRSQGAGGQHVNKTESAIRITHLPSGVVVACQDERSQHQNKDKAMRMLRARLLEAERARRENEMIENRRSQVGTGDRSEKIRTYNFPQSRVTDHRIGLTIHNLSAVMEGDLEPLIQALIAEEQKELLEQVGQA